MSSKLPSNEPSSRPAPVLRDHLAAYRTTLANERTLLAYVRTSLTFFVVGVTFIKFFSHVVITVIGWIFIPLGGIIALKGVASFRKMKRVIQEEGKEGPAASMSND